MEPTRIIYVPLLGEGLDVARPVQAEFLRDGVYRILAQPYDRDMEHWAFEPGDTVVCRATRSNDGEPLMFAFKKLEPTLD